MYKWRILINAMELKLNFWMLISISISMGRTETLVYFHAIESFE